jgi:Fungal Zn(2)-Cys(6) binuclear cluster domain
MSTNLIHPALRADYSSPAREKQSTYGENGRPGYSPLQPSPQSFGATPNYNFVGTHQSHESPEDDTSPAPGGDPNDPNDLKRPRACEACRQLKVKCEPDDNHPTGSCKRCAKANRQCVVTAPSRKRQKKTDSRVAELEKKIDALTASLAARGGHEDPALDPAIGTSQLADLHRQRNASFHEPQWPQNGRQQSMPGPPASNMSQPQAGTKRKLDDNFEYFGQELSKAAPPQPFKSPMPAPIFEAAFTDKNRRVADDERYVDVIDRGVIDMQTAYRCFDRYNAEMCEQLPIVVFPPGTKAEDVRKNKPLLFLAILAVSSGTIRPDLQPKFVSEATRTIADRIVYRGEKSLELCQTVQLMTCFYSPPERYEELNFNQLIHIAAVMALDIGMGKRSRSSAMAIWKTYMDKKGPSLDANAAETRRCWLGVYYMCAK